MKECIKKNKMLLTLTVIFSLLSSVAMVGVSLLLQCTIDKVVSSDVEGFKRVLIFTLIYCGIMAMLYFIYDILSKFFVRNITQQLRSKIFSGIIKHNYKDYTSTNTADYISALTNDIKLLEENYISPLLMVLQFSVVFIATTGVLIYLSPLVTGFLFLSIILILIVPTLFGKKLEGRQMNLSNRLVSFTGKIKDIFIGFEIIKSYNLIKDVTNEFEKENKILANTKFEADKLLVINETLSQLLGMGTQFIAVFLSAYLVLKGKLTMGMLIAIVQLSSTFIQPIIMIMSCMPKITSMAPVIKRLNQMSSYRDNISKGEELSSFDKSIEVNNLTFSYDDNKSVINKISLEIIKNKKYAIVGSSGCGKTTLVKLLLGYYDNYCGEIYWDGKNLKLLDRECLNNMISMIHQNVYIFDKDIKENILLYKEFSNEKIEESLELSGVNKFTRNLDNGIHSKVGENGNNLSGGQKQRIAIARALIRDTPILILDEGTSTIDMQSAYDIERRLTEINSLTLITITHKMSEELLNLYDEIIFMSNGEVVEKGNFKELIQNKSSFYDFYMLETI